MKNFKMLHIPKLRRIPRIIKMHIIAFMWSRRLFMYLLAKNFFRVLASFNKNLKKLYKIFLQKYIETGNNILKRKKFSKFVFWMRDRDFYSLIEVFIDKDYALVNEFLPMRGNVILDLGAGIGDYTLLSSLRVGKRGKVVSIEADTKTYEILLMNIKENELKNVIALDLFVSSEIGQNLDSIVKKIKARRVDLIKMDIEGEEYNAMRGAIETITRFKPKIILEIHSKKLRDKVLNFLKKYSYSLVLEKEKRDHGFLHYFKCMQR